MNTVVILTDHQAYYGRPGVRRPNFERLCREGTHFEQAWCASPLCGPARRSILTGCYPHRHGEVRNDTDHPYDLPPYLDVLKQAGQASYYYGKWHAGPGTALDHGCEGFSYPSYDNPYIRPEYQAYLEELGLPHPEVFVERDFIFWEESNRQGRVVRQDGFWCNEHCSGVMLGPDECHESFFLAHLAKKRLERIAQENDGRPFHLRVDFWGPHPPYFPTRRFADMYSENDITLPLSFYEDVANNHKPQVYATEYNRHISRDGALVYPNPMEQGVWRRVMARAYAQMTQVDAAAGMVLDALEATGLARDTVVIMGTDHGDGLACHGGHFDKGSYLPEEVLRIALAVRWPGRLPGGAASGSYASNMDIGPTVLDAAGLEYPQPVDGYSLAELAEGKTPRDCVVSENHGHFDDHIARALAWDGWKYVYNGSQLEELYRLEDDPEELRNLAVRPEHAGQLNAMRQKLAAWGDAHADGLLARTLCGGVEEKP